MAATKPEMMFQAIDKIATKLQSYTHVSEARGIMMLLFVLCGDGATNPQVYMQERCIKNLKKSTEDVAWQTEFVGENAKRARK
jgi:hypothetical protein